VLSPISSVSQASRLAKPSGFLSAQSFSNASRSAGSLRLSSVSLMICASVPVPSPAKTIEYIAASAGLSLIIAIAALYSSLSSSMSSRRSSRRSWPGWRSAYCFSISAISRGDLPRSVSRMSFSLVAEPSIALNSSEAACFILVPSGCRSCSAAGSAFSLPAAAKASPTRSP
jgi:hypothetical protein